MQEMYNFNFCVFEELCFALFLDSGFRFNYCLQLDIALWRKKAPLYVQIEHSTGMSHCNSLAIAHAH